MTSRTTYWLLAVGVGFFLRMVLPGMGGKAPGWCGDSDNWLFLPGFFAMIALGEVVGLIRWWSRRRISRKPPPIAEDFP